TDGAPRGAGARGSGRPEGIRRRVACGSVARAAAFVAGSGGEIEPLEPRAADRPVLDVGDHHADVAEAQSDIGLRQLAQGLEDQAVEGARTVQRKVRIELAIQV